MPNQQFAYTGRAAGAAVSGELEAADASAVALLLQARGVVPLTVRPLRPGQSLAGHAGQTGLAGTAKPSVGWLKPKVQVTDLMLFSRQLHTLLRAGVPILRALAGLQDSSVNPTMKSTLAAVRHRLESGTELSKCLAQQSSVFNAFYVSMVRVGEMTGRLDDVFMRLFQHIEFEHHMQQQVRSALRYPGFVVAAMAVAVVVINLMVIPAFAQVFKAFNADLPLPTQLLIGMSGFMLQWGWMLAALAALAALVLRQWVRQPTGELAWARLKLRLPLAGPIVQKATLARFSRSLALSLRSGIPIEQALQVVAQTVDNAHIARKVDAMREAVARGDTILRAAGATGVFTPVVLQMLAVGEETGAIDELLDEIAQLYNNEVQYDLKALSQQIEPILIVFLGVMVLVLALGVFLPLWDLGRVALKK